MTDISISCVKITTSPVTLMFRNAIPVSRIREEIHYYNSLQTNYDVTDMARGKGDFKIVKYLWQATIIIGGVFVIEQQFLGH